MKIKHFIPLLIIVVLTLALRLILLDRIPTGITNDELDYIINAKAIYLSGKDITNTWSPLSLTTPPKEYPKAELPYLIISPFIGPANFSLFWARFPYVIISTITILFVYLISKKLLGENIAIYIGLIATINPWSIYFGRTAFEAPMSVMFYLIALYILLSAKKLKILLAFPFLFLGFYTYIGAKTTLIPFIIVISLFSFFAANKRKYFKQYLCLFLFCLGLVGLFLFSGSKNLNRTSELANLNNPNVTNKVIQDRKMSIETAFTNIFINKPVVFAEELINKFYGFYSTDFLFLYSDSQASLSVWNHGVFYYIDAVFILIGLYYLFETQRKFFYLIVGTLLISPIPTLLSTTNVTYSTRSSLALPFLIILVGSGIYAFINIRSLKGYKSYLMLLIAFIYLASLANFMNIYLFRNPIYNSEAFGLSQRILSKYTSLASNYSEPVIFVEKTSGNAIPTVFKQYLFYTNSYNENTYKQVTSNINKGLYAFNNFSVQDCPGKTNSTIVTTPNSKCKIDNVNKLTIAQLSDGGTIYNVQNDKVCSKYALNRYPNRITLDDLNIEGLSEEKFCTTFITKL